jgi:hypothetical protein
MLLIADRDIELHHDVAEAHGRKRQCLAEACVARNRPRGFIAQLRQVTRLAWRLYLTV